ncbi:MAG TPA: methyltransferase domain-containing protein [Candidatus Nitrosotenuis sp.]|nr:methyltransferase domain-containing protein [Candidatus Nitrosotenuis sp.]
MLDRNQPVAARLLALRQIFPQSTGERLFWDYYAVCYDALTRLSAYKAMLARVVQVLEPEPGMRLLDAGCGTGNVLDYVFTACPQADLLGIDFSPAMLRRAIPKVPDANFGYCDLNEGPLPFANEQFDAITCVNVLYILREPVAVLREFHRVLRPGGRVVITNPVPGFRPLTILIDHIRNTKTVAAWVEIMARVPQIISILGLNALIVNKGQKRVYNFSDAERLRAWAGAVDFRTQLIEPIYAGQDLLAVLAREALT